jgi:hypothetical protein
MSALGLAVALDSRCKSSLTVKHCRIGIAADDLSQRTCRSHSGNRLEFDANWVRPSHFGGPLWELMPADNSGQ